LEWLGDEHKKTEVTKKNPDRIGGKTWQKGTETNGLRSPTQRTKGGGV